MSQPSPRDQKAADVISTFANYITGVEELHAAMNKLVSMEADAEPNSARLQQRKRSVLEMTRGYAGELESCKRILREIEKEISLSSSSSSASDPPTSS